MVSVAGLFLSVATSFSVYLILVLLFTFLSRSKQNSVVYYPARLIKGLQPTTSGTIHYIPKWIYEALFTSSEQVAEFAGLDAAVYMRFLYTGFQISSAVALYGLLVLIPICATDNFYEDYNAKHPKNTIAYDEFDLISMGNVSKRSKKMWAFIAGAWWMTFCTFYFLHRSSEAITIMLANFNGSKRARLNQLTILVRDIPQHPPGKTRQEQVDEYFSQLYPSTYVKSVVILQLGRVLAIWKELKSCEEKLKHEEAVLASTGIRPTHKEGLWGFRRKVDSIDFYQKKINQLRPQLEKEQMQTLETNTTAGAFVFFKSRTAATKAAQAIHSRRGDTWTVSPAPDPRAVRWGDVATSLYDRGARTFFVWAATWVIVIFFLIPVLLVSALANVRSLEKNFSFLTPILELPILKGVLDAYLPQLVLYGSLAMVPYFILTLVNLEGYPSEGGLWGSAADKIYLVLVFNVFLGLTITLTATSTLATSLRQIVEKPTVLFDLLGSTIPTNATFYISYVALIFYISYGLELSRIVPLVVYWMKKRTLVTEEEQRAAWAPAALQYHLVTPQDLLILTLGLCYAVISPAILPFCVIYFCFARLTYGHQILNVYVPKWEGGGQMWPRILTRVLAALTLAQLTLIGYFGLNSSYPTLCLLPLPFITWLYGWSSATRFRPTFDHTPLEVVQQPVVDEPSVAQLLLAYTPECMHGEQVYAALGEPEAVRVEELTKQIEAEEVSASAPLLNNV